MTRRESVLPEVFANVSGVFSWFAHDWTQFYVAFRAIGWASAVIIFLPSVYFCIASYESLAVLSQTAVKLAPAVNFKTKTRNRLQSSAQKALEYCSLDPLMGPFDLQQPLLSSYQYSNSS